MKIASAWLCDLHGVTVKLRLVVTKLGASIVISLGCGSLGHQHHPRAGQPRKFNVLTSNSQVHIKIKNIFIFVSHTVLTCCCHLLLSKHTLSTAWVTTSTCSDSPNKRSCILYYVLLEYVTTVTGLIHKFVRAHTM